MTHPEQTRNGGPGGSVVLIAVLFGVWAWLPVRWRNGRFRSTASRISRLVLPLGNLSGGVEQESFADGMTDLLITNLAHIGALRVISRASVMRFRNHNQPLHEIARQLGVEAFDRRKRAVILQSGTHHGSVNRSGQRSAIMGSRL